MEEVNATGQKFIVTKHGQPVVAVVPAVQQPAPSIIGWCPGIRIHDDLREPAIPAEQWNTLSDSQRLPAGVPGGDEH